MATDVVAFVSVCNGRIRDLVEMAIKPNAKRVTSAKNRPTNRCNSRIWALKSGRIKMTSPFSSVNGLTIKVGLKLMIQDSH